MSDILDEEEKVIEKLSPFAYGEGEEKEEYTFKSCAIPILIMMGIIGGICRSCSLI